MTAIVPLSEVTTINKQRFLAELGKLLTFMYEEDRQRAIAMYAKMFEDAPDEQALLQVLGSPTRQAVIVARAYNAKERKLQVEAQSRELEEDEQESPDYLLAIQEIYDKAIPEPVSGAPLEDQFSLFDEPEDEPEDEPDEEEALPVAPLPEEEDLTPPEEPVEPAPAAALPPDPVEPEPEAAEAEEAPADGDEVDAFLASFTIEGDELIDRQTEAEAQSEAEEAALPEEAAEPETPTAPEADSPDEEEAEDEDEADEEDEAPRAATTRRAKPLLLILYILLAIPVCLVGVAVLLIPTLLSLGLAVGVIAVGAALLITAFSGFAVLADILLVLGAALVVLALGLLLLWLFIWFIGGPIVGLIRGAFRLGGRWCYEEVAA